MTIYKCVDEDCGQIVLSNEPPEPLKWSDGHVCFYIEFQLPTEPPITYGTEGEMMRGLERRHNQLRKGGGELR